ncbi:Wadjet anti-phage system protein JetD domain-containing protein [Rhizobium sp. 18055]|uniref:Wadjet anti-phage system protein JetD domain-containing protein n=1 Tax=Rhizobium sp. 18055 TaxID=2681403 RepID=UPI001FCEFF0B|nr:Wadjet anti-phage system protein JetD domain-containing protein [Rhizobium sp. 18055]
MTKSSHGWRRNKLVARKFETAAGLLNDLLDRFEAGTAQPVGYPDHDAFLSVTASDTFARATAEAERAGCVERVWGVGRRRAELKFVRLADAPSLYRFLDRIPAREAAAGVGEAMLDGLDLHPKLREAVLAAIDAWSRNRTWASLGRDDAVLMRTAIMLAQAMLDGSHRGLDYRTFSRRTVANSKALERLEGPVLRLIGSVVDVPPSSNARAAFAALGLERFGPPLLLSGAFLLDRQPVSPSLPYLGIPPTAMMRIGFDRLPAYVLTIENFASFNRHVLEADPDRVGLTLYVGGYPSLATQKALSELGTILPLTVPFFHWSDIDPDGTWIFRTIERELGRVLRPHLMSRELAEEYGEPLAGYSRLRRNEASHSLISDLANYFAEPGAKIMEQEQIDPQIPNWLKAD